MFIGRRVKELREKQKMQLIELAEKSGVQIATLSRIEHNRMTGSLDSHMRIAKALGISLPGLYEDLADQPVKMAESQPQATSSSTSPKDIFVHNVSASSEILTNKILSKKMMPVMLKIEAGGKTNNEINPQGSEKFVYVLEGQLSMKIGGEDYSIQKNHSLYFNAAGDHYFFNRGKTPVKALVITTPVTL